MFKILKSKNTERIRWWWRFIDIFALNFNPTSVWLAEYQVPCIPYVFTHKRHKTNAAQLIRNRET